MIAARGASIGEQVRAMYKKLGREFWPVPRESSSSDEQKANAVKRVAVDSSTLAAEKSYPSTATDGAKFVLDDGSWMCCCGLSGTEPLLRLYVKPKGRRIREVDARSITMGAAKLNKMGANEKNQTLLAITGPRSSGLLARSSWCTHFRYLLTGYLAMRRTQQEIKR